jgi:rod shape-determining protein MreC
VPRNRTVSAVLGSTVQRAAPPYASRSSTALRRRIVVVGLVLLALVLITFYFRESAAGGLHRVQNGGAVVLRPFEVGAERVARPFRDVYGYFHGLVVAKGQNKELRNEVRALRQRVVAGESAAQQVDRLRALLRFEDGPQFPQDYTPVNTRVINHASDFAEEVVVAAGSANGVVEHAPVVTSDGLVGDVTLVGRTASRVTLLTDDQSAVGAYDVKTGAMGVIRHGPSSDNSLILDRVTKDLNVEKGDVVVTAGTRSRRFPSLYPRNIAIGRVTSVGQTDTDTYKQIQVDPFVDFGSLDAVAVLITHKAQPQLP